ncbi:hypothetical protein B9Z19DRAFT_1077933 [Tuber borchii]|uniref:Uncharacterized protein n=1 Tax=Tuber borchii TaxID=42251 RepID=A0A2T7A078_TUBBO|nr:hypothetical protein B9Z19DRAFT_1077933 [Tuber borchii]
MEKLTRKAPIHLRSSIIPCLTLLKSILGLLSSRPVSSCFLSSPESTPGLTGAPMRRKHFGNILIGRSVTGSSLHAV